ncbi:MAG: chemotaxis protein CheD [bacterium]|nr:chemotaxis protein CheD [bacterium]
MGHAATASRDALRVVGIGAMVVSSDVREVLVTYSLGSCIGVTVHDPGRRVGGLIHCMLPSSKLDAEKAKTKPHMFADTGVLALLQGVMDLGADRERLVVKVAGAGSPMDPTGRFKIGERNVTMLRKVLWKNDLLLSGEDTGGTEPRTMSLEMGSGRTSIRKPGGEVEL